MKVKILSAFCVTALVAALIGCSDLTAMADSNGSSDPSATTSGQTDTTPSAVAVTGVSISGQSTVAAGSTITLAAIVSPTNATSKTVTWSVTGGSSCASVDSSTGVVTGLLAGQATITATADGKKATTTITVTSTADNMENTDNTVTAGATVGTSLTGTKSSFVATDTTWDTLVWSDEFEGTSLKTANWISETGNNGGWGNAELETYTASGNAIVKGNVLDIAAKSDLTSARLKSAGLKAFQYGRIEARIKCSQGTGSWPAFWMLGTSSSQWPYQGEIDILEHANNDVFTYQTCHWNGNGSDPATAFGHAYYGKKTNNNGFTDIPSLNVTAWHVYAIEWTSTAINFYVDDKKVMAMAVGGSAGTGLDAFNHPFYILLNFAMGGQFPGVTDAGQFAGLPWHMYVDYVRVFQ